MYCSLFVIPTTYLPSYLLFTGAKHGLLIYLEHITLHSAHCTLLTTHAIKLPGTARNTSNNKHPLESCVVSIIILKQSSKMKSGKKTSYIIKASLSAHHIFSNTKICNFWDDRATSFFMYI